MLRSLIQAVILATALFCALIARAIEPLDSNVEVVISIADERMALLCDGELVARFPVSTSKFGVGDALGSYRTPLGRLRICDKIGDNLPAGAVIKHRQATGEVLPVNALGRDPIVSRILWLEGLEDQNRNARARSIYIHGTPEESTIGKSVSWGCIRMRSSNVIELYDSLPVGTPVTIIAERLPRYPKYIPKPPELIPNHIATPPPPLLVSAAAPSPIKSSKPAKLITIAATPPHVVLAPIAALGARENEPAHAAAPVDPKGPSALRGSILLSGLSPMTPTALREAPKHKHSTAPSNGSSEAPPAVPDSSPAIPPPALPATAAAETEGGFLDLDRPALVLQQTPAEYEQEGLLFHPQVEAAGSVALGR